MSECSREGTVIATMGGRAGYRPREHWVKALMLVESLRRFGGRHAQDRVLVMAPGLDARRAPDIEDRIARLGAEVHSFAADAATLDWDPAAKTAAAAAAEEVAADAREIVWVDSDTLVLGDLEVVELGPATDVAYCPVYKVNVGSRFDEPLDGFWSLVYEVCGVTDAEAFPLSPWTERAAIRPYINLGFVVVRPSAAILRTWADRCRALLADPRAKPFVDGESHRPFVHQAILSGVVTGRAGRTRQLPVSVNYARPSHDDFPEEFRARRLNDLITCRYDYPFEINSWEAILPAEPPLSQWLKEKRESLAPLLDPDRLKAWSEALAKHGIRT
jgi:hypothetical protein